MQWLTNTILYISKCHVVILKDDCAEFITKIIYMNSLQQEKTIVYLQTLQIKIPL
jgi:hypothetical protein